MSIFYKNKLYRDQYDRARFNGSTRENARSTAELVTLGIYGFLALIAFAIFIFFLIAVYIVIVVINSPGISIVELLKSYGGLEMDRAASWIFSLTISSAIFFALHFLCKAKHKVLGLAIYASLCLITSLSVINLHDESGKRIGLKLLSDYAPQETIANTTSKFFGGTPSKGVEEVKNTPTNSAPAIPVVIEQKTETITLEKDVVVEDPIVSKVESDLFSQTTGADEKAAANTSAPDNFQPSFDCRNATYNSEKIICSNYELSVLDNVLADKYRALRLLTENNPELKTSQINWIKSLRLCEDAACMKPLYENRLVELDSYHIHN